MVSEEQFHYQLAKSIQAWLWIETQVYLLYAEIMEGANPHLVSVTFHNIESFEAKLCLIDSCLSLIFTKDSDNWKKWRALLNKARKYNAKRNKIVHQPIMVGVLNDVETIRIAPSFLNAQALAKGQTTYKGAVISPEYKNSLAKITKEHEIDLLKLREFESEFKEFSKDLRAYREEISVALKAAHESVKNEQE